MLELVLNGIPPAAILLRQPDVILCLGVFIAEVRVLVSLSLRPRSTHHTLCMRRSNLDLICSECVLQEMFGKTIPILSLGADGFDTISKAKYVARASRRHATGLPQ